jgi:hypothetical protein
MCGSRLCRSETLDFPNLPFPFDHVKTDHSLRLIVASMHAANEAPLGLNARQSLSNGYMRICR